MVDTRIDTNVDKEVIARWTNKKMDIKVDTNIDKGSKKSLHKGTHV